MSDRGWGNSCGGTDPERALQPVCADGYNHLMDTRFEVRDAQESSRRSPTARRRRNRRRGPIDPQKIGATGGSYGGGISMALAALQGPQDDLGRRRLAGPVDEPGRQADADRRRGAGHPLDRPRLLAACRTGTRSTTSPTRPTWPSGSADRRREAVLRRRPLRTGQAMSNYAPPGTDPDADLTTWYALINAGEPYDPNPLSQRHRRRDHHAPLLVLHRPLASRRRRC